jgi:GGDEF domain-containing protein
LQRSRQGTLTNPITGLPEGSLVDEALVETLENDDSTLMIVSLKNLNRFREVYGFVASDDLLRAISLMVRDIVREMCAPDDFLGHLNNSDFLIISASGRAAALRERVRKRLEPSFDYFYADHDREKGTFRDKQLGVTIHELATTALTQRNLAYLKEELSRFCH